MKRLTIAEIEEEPANVPVWALNATAEVRVAGDLIISIPKLNGSKVDSLSLPSTWLPVCLTEQIPKMQLLASSEFRKSVNRGAIILITPDYAAELNSQYGAEEERERLAEQERRVFEATRSQGVHSEKPDLVNEADTMDPAFVIFFDSLKEKSDAEAYNQLRTRSRFTSAELQYMARNLIEKPNSLKHINTLLRG